VGTKKTVGGTLKISSCVLKEFEITNTTGTTVQRRNPPRKNVFNPTDNSFVLTANKLCPDS
jgi:hypothetical protein